MRGPDDLRRAVAGRKSRSSVALVALALLLAGCSAGGQPGGALGEPSGSVLPVPDYPAACAPIGADTTSTCLRITLEAIDAARAREDLRPMVLPSDFPRLTIPEQLFVAIDRERVDRGLPPFIGLDTALDATAQTGADSAQLPPRPGHTYTSTVTEWIGAVDNGLDADYQWMYEDGPNSGVPGCSDTQSSGCWADRQSVLGRLGSHHLVMGAGFDPSGDTSSGDRGGSSLAAILAVSSSRSSRSPPRSPDSRARHTPTPGTKPWRRRRPGGWRHSARFPPPSPRPASPTPVRTSHRCPTTRVRAQRAASTPPPRASRPFSPRSTTRTRWKESGPWSCLQGSHN